MRRTAVLVALSMVCLAGCGQQTKSRIEAVKAKVRGDVAFTTNRPAMILAADESEDLAYIERLPVNGYMNVGQRCQRGYDVRAVTPRVVNYRGKLSSEMTPGASNDVVAWHILVDNRFLANRAIHREFVKFFGPAEQVRYACQVHTEALAKWMAGNVPYTGNADGRKMIAFASRGDLKFEYESAYETEIPLKGKTQVVALKFSYDLKPTLPDLKVPTRGTGAAKAYFDRDTGEWQFMNFELHDPDVQFNPAELDVIHTDERLFTPPVAVQVVNPDAAAAPPAAVAAAAAAAAAAPAAPSGRHPGCPPVNVAPNCY
jgi:hypothetical protein